MPKQVVIALIATAIAGSAAADEMLVFKKDSAYKGAAMRVSSYERREGRLLIKGPQGEVFSAAEDAVDWSLSRKFTDALRQREASDATRQAEESRQRRATEAHQEAKPLGLVEASRRYGVEKPAVSVAAGSAAREVVVPGAQDATAGSPPAAEGGSGGGAVVDAPEVKAARDRLAASRAEYDKLNKEIAALRADNNPDPVSSAQRESRLKDKMAALAEQQKRVQAAEEAAAKAVADAVKKAGEQVATKSAAKPAEKPAEAKATPAAKK